MNVKNEIMKLECIKNDHRNNERIKKITNLYFVNF